MAFDIAKTNLAKLAEDGYEFEVELPDGTPTEWFITVRGKESPVMKRYLKKIITKMQRDDQVNARKGKKDVFNYDETQEQITEGAVVRIVNWRGLEENGKELPFTEENARRVLTENDWVRPLIIDASDTDANFI